MPLDQVETLKRRTRVAAPLVLGDKKLKETIVEGLPQQDQYEVHPIALRVHALAHMIAGRARR